MTKIQHQIVLMFHYQLFLPCSSIATPAQGVLQEQQEGKLFGEGSGMWHPTHFSGSAYKISQKINPRSMRNLSQHVFSHFCHSFIIKLYHPFRYLAVAHFTTDCFAKLLIPMCVPVINFISAQLQGFQPSSCTVAFYLLWPQPKCNFFFFFKLTLFELSHL